MKFYEVQKYVTAIRYIFSIEPLVVSEAIFQDMDEATQQAVLEAGKEATLHSAAHLRASEAAIKEDLLARACRSTSRLTARRSGSPRRRRRSGPSSTTRSAASISSTRS